jgi:hypothetical protein
LPKIPYLSVPIRVYPYRYLSRNPLFNWINWVNNWPTSQLSWLRHELRWIGCQIRGSVKLIASWVDYVHLCHCHQVASPKALWSSLRSVLCVLCGKSADNRQASMYLPASEERYEVMLLPWIYPFSQSQSTCVLLANASSGCQSNNRQRCIRLALVDIASCPGTSANPVPAD